ncbi:flavodoxin-dependent (E)-4-hydroxy-3-methylbut-2-enyl-diphosphate synthase [Buchnera aphidicola (Neophyllaphis podocarpi)]|uniref:flavodoxin-dependent (E)-4-hydroxy-3-methylbut-2-enyl-diphosphate synthase n=1 Tax=Buchnera aphidicola TaxID=9 RepID=UPI0031B83F37
MYYLNNYKRRKSKRIYVGNVPIGDNAPISIQSMTSTNTIDIKSTINQILLLKKAGAEIVRISIPSMQEAEAFRIIKKNVNIPLIADIHFDYRIAIKAAEYGADGLRINPGNIGNYNRIKQVVLCAKNYNIPIRIGVNAGSLEKKILKNNKFPTPELLLESAMNHIKYFDKLNFDNFKVSIKASNVILAIESYELLSKNIDQPIHLGITESGGLLSGSIKSSIGIGLLLYKGIGDTIRVSLAADPVEEVKVAFNILQSLNIRHRGINFIACPTCSRKEFDVINIVKILEKRLQDITIPMNVSIIGCAVNGLGEALTSTIGIVGGKNSSALYQNGNRLKERLNNKEMLDILELKIRNQANIIKNKKT